MAVMSQNQANCCVPGPIENMYRIPSTSVELQAEKQ